MSEARLEESGAGQMPVSEGWYVVNARDSLWLTSESGGAVCPFEGKDIWFPQVGVRLRVLEPGQPNALYHEESNQEDFLVLSGECLVLIEEQERRLRAWDFVHCPPGTRHVFVGAGDGPCAILMVGARSKDEQISYPASELAARHGAAATKPTTSPREAYADFPKHQARRFPWPPT